MDPTNVDLYNAMKYATERGKLRFLERLQIKYPHIASHLLLNIKRATLDDYYYSRNFEDYAIKVTIKIDKTACSQINCMPWTYNGPCKKGDKPTHFKENDKVLGVSCGHACYNLKPKNKEINIPPTKWTNGHCQLVPPTDIWMHFPISRDEARFSIRQNDFTSGFNLVQNKISPTGYTFTYTQNYCERFKTQYDLNTDNCIEPAYWFFADAIIGKSFLTTIIEFIENKEIGKQEPLPILADYKYTLEEWKANISNRKFPPANVKVSELDNFILDNIDANWQEIKATQFKDSVIHTRENLPTDERRLLEEINSKLVLPKKISTETLTALLSSLGIVAYGIYTQELLKMLADMFTDPKTWIGFSDTIIFELIKLTLRKFGTFFSNLAISTTKVFSKNILKSSMSALLAKTISQMTLSMTSKIMVGLAKIVAEVESVVGIIFIFTTLFDLILTFWDPFGFNKQFPPGYIQDLSINFATSFIQEVGTSNLEFTFDHLCYSLFNKEEILEISLLQFEDVYNYLDSLTVNSNGSVIDKGDQVKITDDDKNRGDVLVNDLNKTAEMNQVNLYKYEYNHKQRFLNVALCNFVGYIFVIVGGALLIFKSTLLSIILIVIGILLGCLGYFYTSTNILPYNFYEKLEGMIDNKIFFRLFSKFISIF